MNANEPINAEGEIIVRRWARTTNDQIAEVLELWRSGLTYNEIRIITGVNHSTMKTWVTKHWFEYRGDNGMVLRLTSKV